MRGRKNLVDVLATPAILVLVIGVLVVIGVTGSSWSSFAATALINVLLVVGLYVFSGNSGVLNFGHIGFAALGAYICAFLTIPVIAKGVLLPELPGWMQTIELSTTLAVVVSALVAAIVGGIAAVPLMRMVGLRAAIATLALLIIVNTVFTSWVAGGSGSVTRVPVDATPEMLGAWGAVFIVVGFGFQRSRWGIRLQATREDEVAARSAGIGIYPERSIAFVLSAFMMGAAGALYAHYLGSFDPSVFYLSLTILTIAMLLVGGMTSLTGAVCGAVVLSLVTEVFRRFESGEGLLVLHLHIPAGYREMLIALLLIVVLIVRPAGLTKGREVGGLVRSLPREVDPDGSAAE